mgnify:FL=1
MLDIKLFRTDPEAVKTALARRGDDTSAVDRVVELDSRLRVVGTERDDVRSEINNLSKRVGQLHRDGKGAEAVELQTRSKELGERESVLDEEAETLQDKLRHELLNIANMPADDAPDGLTEDDNVVIRVENLHRLHQFFLK